MTQLAHDAAILGLPVDPLALYRADLDAVLFVDTVVDRINETYEERRSRS